MQIFDIQAFIDRQRINAQHLVVLGLVVLVMFIDGFDIFMVGKIAPAIAKDFGITPAEMTLVFLLQQAGLAVGAFFVSPLSDIYGRKRMLVISSIIFGMLTLLTTQVTTVTQLALLRGVSGLFLSGVLPAAIALVSEFTPKYRRSTFIAIGMAGYSAGSAAGAAVAFLVPSYGWQGGFWIGGMVPLLVVPFLLKWLPESLSYQVSKNPHDPKVPQTIQRIEPGIVLTGDEQFVAAAGRKKSKVKLTDIVGDGRTRSSFILWACCFLSMGNIALLAAWLPTFFQEMAGVSIQKFAFSYMISFLGGLAGTLTIGFLMDRVRPTRLIPAYFLTLSVTLLLMGQIPFGSPLFILLLLLWSFCQAGGQAGLNMLATQVYPTEIRSTGLGWAGGAGRIGGIVAPALGGLALASAFTLPFTLMMVALPPLGVALLILLLKTQPKPETAAQA